MEHKVLEAIEQYRFAVRKALRAEQREGLQQQQAAEAAE